MAKSPKYIRISERDIELRPPKSERVWKIEAELGEFWESATADLGQALERVWGEKFPFWTYLAIESRRRVWVGGDKPTEKAVLTGYIPARRQVLLATLSSLSLLAESRKISFSVFCQGKHYNLAVEANEDELGTVLEIKLKGIKKALKRL